MKSFSFPDSDWRKIYEALQAAPKVTRSHERHLRQSLKRQIGRWQWVGSKETRLERLEIQSELQVLHRTIQKLRAARESAEVGKLVIDDEFFYEVDHLDGWIERWEGRVFGDPPYNKNHHRDLLINKTYPLSGRSCGTYCHAGCRRSDFVSSAL
jgi:hypothetical protein